MDNNVIEGDFTVQEELNIPEAPKFHTVLEVWREVLRPARKEAKNRVTAGWAAKVINSYGKIDFADMNDFRDLYYAKIDELLTILEAEIDSDPDCLSYDSPEDDALENRLHYKNLLRDWQKAILGWELAWDCADPFAAIELGAISEVHKMFFGQTGLTQFLDNIRFEYTPDDQQELADELEAMRSGVNGE
jgi:hypothetical protein